MTIFAAAMSSDNKKFLSLAVPLIISSISTPLLGVVDTAVMGRFPQAAYIGGVAIATLIFNTMYWLLGFLRISTSGFSAQASGTGDKKTITSALLRPMAIAFILGVLLVVLQYPIKIAAFMLVTPSDSVRTLAETYYDIRIWGAPFVLIGYVMNGWLAGMSKVKLSLCLQIFMNILNILLVLLFVRIGGMAADGVATATLISEIAATVLGFVLIYHIKEVSITGISLAIFCNIAAFTAMMKVNRDLFIRTVCLLSV
ncbi:MAG: MATE family efflux transporter, partial [Sporomusaceae bacterium]|nr:MATE family efflux transporter [Sporomusaceae bacterium]